MARHRGRPLRGVAHRHRVPERGSQVGSFCEYTGTAFEVRDLGTNRTVVRVDFGGPGRFMLRASDGERPLHSLHRPRPGHDLQTGEA